MLGASVDFDNGCPVRLVIIQDGVFVVLRNVTRFGRGRARPGEFGFERCASEGSRLSYWLHMKGFSGLVRHLDSHSLDPVDNRVSVRNIADRWALRFGQTDPPRIDWSHGDARWASAGFVASVASHDCRTSWDSSVHESGLTENDQSIRMDGRVHKQNRKAKND